MNEEWLRVTIEWLRKRVDAAEDRDPELRSLKKRVNDAHAAVLTSSADKMPAVLRTETDAIWALLKHISAGV